MTGRPRQIAVVLAALFNVVLNSLAGAGLLFGVETGTVSDASPTPITAAGWTFSIWSVIFLGLLVFAAWQARAATRDARYDAVAVPFIVGNVLTGLWQIPWLLGWLGVAAVGLFAIVACVAWLYVRLDRMSLRGAERWALGVPTALWLAWVTVAAALNVAVTGVAAGMAGDPLVGAGVVVAVGAIGAWLVSRTADLAMTLVFLWAFAGIAAAQDTPVIRGALVMAALLVVGALALARRRGLSFWPTAHA